MRTLMRFSVLLKYSRRSSSSVQSRCDRHNCVHFDLSNLPEKVISSQAWRSAFLEELVSLCGDGNSLGPKYNAIWVHISPAQGNLLPALSNPPPYGLGLTLHHTKIRLISLYRWLCSDTDRVPAFATHKLGVVAATLRGDEKVLLVREKSENSFQGWKFPSGRVNFGESLADAALRELREETGLQQVHFNSLLGIRETCDGSPNDASELLALCHLSSPASPIEIAASMRPCPHEIKAMDWFPLSSIFEAHVCRTIEDKMETELEPSPRLYITPLTRIIADMLHLSLSVQAEGDGIADTFNGLIRRSVRSILPGRKHHIYLPPLISSGPHDDI